MSRSRWVVWIAGLVLVVLGSAMPSPVSAQRSDDEQARLHFQVAASYYEQGDYESALREFQSAYRLSQRPQLLYNLSVCYQQLGNLDEAVSNLERYLAEVAEIENRLSLEQRLGNLRARRDRQRETGTDPGESGSEPGTGAEPGTGTSTGTQAVAAASGGDGTNVPAIAGFAVAGVGLVAALVFSGLTLAEDGRVGGLPCAAARSCSGDDVGTLNTFALVSDVSWGVSLAGAIVGTIFLFVPTGSGQTDSHAHLRVEPLIGSTTGLSLNGSF